jgi:hypothetical protein
MPIRTFPSIMNIGPTISISVLTNLGTDTRNGNDSESGAIVPIIPHIKKLAVVERIRDL